jgi:hypothetical protein
MTPLGPPDSDAGEDEPIVLDLMPAACPDTGQAEPVPQQVIELAPAPQQTTVDEEFALKATTSPRAAIVFATFAAVIFLCWLLFYLAT